MDKSQTESDLEHGESVDMYFVFLVRKYIGPLFRITSVEGSFYEMLLTWLKAVKVC